MATDPMLAFPNGELPVGADIAFGEDPLSDPTGWNRVDVSAVLLDSDIQITRGRQNSTTEISPTAGGIELDNDNGDFTPDFGGSQYWPNVDLGQPAREWVLADPVRLVTDPLAGPGAYIAATTDLDIAGDLEVQVDFRMRSNYASPDFDTVQSTLVGVNAVGDVSWVLTADTDQAATLWWSPDGLEPYYTATSTVPVMPARSRSSLKVTLDVNNGAGGSTVRFYRSDSIDGPWVQVGDDVVVGDVTAVWPAVADLNVGAAPGFGDEWAPDAEVYALRVLDGIGGTPVVDVDFTAQLPNTVGFVDDAGRTWNIDAPAEITNRYYRIVGTTDAWEPDWPDGDLSAQQEGGLGVGESTCAVTISGILRRLRAGIGLAPARSAAAGTISNRTDVVGYWPMEDGEDSTQIASGLPNGDPMNTVGELVYQQFDGPPGSQKLLGLTATSGLTWFVAPSGASEFTVTWLQHIAPLPASLTTIHTVVATGTGVSFTVQVSNTTLSLAVINAASSTISSGSVAVPAGWDLWKWLSLHVEQNGGNVDWELTAYDIDFGNAAFLSGSFAGTIGNLFGGYVPTSANLAGMGMGHLTAVAGDYAPDPRVFGGFPEELAGARLSRVADEYGIPMRMIGSINDTDPMGPQPFGDFFDVADEVVDLDGGVLYENPNAIGLVYRTRVSRYNQPDDLVLDATLEELQPPFRPIRDDQGVVNDVTVKREGGSSVRVVDTASVQKIGTYDTEVTVNVAFDSLLQGIAAWMVAVGAVSGMRYPQVAIDLAAAPQLIPQWVVVDIASRVRVVNLPPQHPDEAVPIVVEGYNETQGQVDWAANMALSPGAVWDVGTISPAPGIPEQQQFRLRSAGSVTNETVDIGETAVDVDVTAGQGWTTDAGQFPFELSLGGERVTVTAIGAMAGSVQTFTIVRGARARAHAAGVPVQPWFPGRLRR